MNWQSKKGTEEPIRLKRYSGIPRDERKLLDDSGLSANANILLHAIAAEMTPPSEGMMMMMMSVNRKKRHDEGAGKL